MFMPDEGNRVRINIDNDETELEISELAKELGEEKAAKFLEDNGLDYEQLLDEEEVSKLSEVESRTVKVEPRVTKSSLPFSNIHLQTAVELSEQVAILEDSPNERGGYLSNWGFAIGSITSCMSFLDSIINEFVDDVSRGVLAIYKEDEETDNKTDFDSSHYDMFENLEDEILDWRNMPTLKKYQVILIVFGKEPFDRGSQPFQDVDIVRRLRNYFVHYNPEMYKHHQEEVQHRLGSALQGKFELNPLADESDPYFPDKTLSHGCTEWCIGTVVEFTDEFFKRLGLIPPYRTLSAYRFNEWLDEK